MDNKIAIGHTEVEAQNRKKMMELFKDSKIHENEFLANLGIFIKRQDLGRILFLNEIYCKMLNTFGVIMDFGTRWGQNAVIFTNLRGIYEPFNYNRKIIAFDSFNGFTKTDKKDGNDKIIKKGAYDVVSDYDKCLENILECHEKESPISHIKKFEIIKGEATKEIVSFFDRCPETIVSLAYFDFDLYVPTKKCLKKIKNHLTKGSILAFDELGSRRFPGETLALKEIFEINKLEIIKSNTSPAQSYCII